MGGKVGSAIFITFNGGGITAAYHTAHARIAINTSKIHIFIYRT